MVLGGFVPVEIVVVVAVKTLVSVPVSGSSVLVLWPKSASPSLPV